MDAYVLNQPPRKPKPKYGIDLCKALKTMGFNGWSELVPGMYSNLNLISCFSSSAKTFLHNVSSITCWYLNSGS